MESRLFETDEKEIITESILFSNIVNDREYFQKQRKLTSDSGYGDEISDSAFSDICNMNTSLGNIVEDSSSSNSNDFRDNLQEVIKTYQDVTLNDRNEEECRPSVDDAIERSKRKRRVTPVPHSVNNTKPSQGVSTQNVVDSRKILFVEEEDDDDVEKYNYEDDYICQDILSCQRYAKKRNSWHGHTEDEILQGYKKRLITLQKSKSLDRGKDQTRKRRRRLNMSTSALTVDHRKTFEKPLSFLDAGKSKDFSSVGNQTTCYSFTNMSKQWEKENSICAIQVSVEQANTNNNKPLWMKEAEADMTSSDTGSCVSDDESQRAPDDDALSTKLQIPNINWEKLSETKNKNNEMLSNQRKVLTKQKNKDQRAQQRRRRKLTPSESPSSASLEKLSNLKNHAENWILEEEEEEEES